MRVRKSIVFKLSTIIEPSKKVQFGEDSRQPLKSIGYHKNSFESTLPVLSFKKQGQFLRVGSVGQNDLASYDENAEIALPDDI